MEGPSTDGSDSNERRPQYDLTLAPCRTATVRRAILTRPSPLRRNETQIGGLPKR
jgi:hypothetical protein